MGYLSLSRHSLITWMTALGLLMNLVLDLDGNHDAQFIKGPEQITAEFQIEHSKDQCNDAVISPAHNQTNQSSQAQIPLFTPHFGHGEFITDARIALECEEFVSGSNDGYTMSFRCDRHAVAPPVPPPNFIV